MNLRKRLMLLLCLSLCVMPGLSGCAVTRRVVLVKESDAMFRVGPKTRARVYFWNGKEWELTRNRVELPEGWFIGPPLPDAPEPLTTSTNDPVGVLR